MDENLNSDVVEETTIEENVELDNEEIQETDETQEGEETSEDDESNDESNEEKPNPLEEKINKMQYGFEKRIGKVTAKYKTLEEENAQLKQMLHQQQNPIQKKDRSDFNNDEEWINHLADQRVQEMMANQNKAYTQQQQAMSQQQALANSWEEKVNKMTNDIPDYAEALQNVDEDVVLPNDVAQAVLESDVGPLLAYHFAKNPAEIEKVSVMSERQVDRYLARLEYKVETEHNNRVKGSSAKVTKAVAPTPKTVGNPTSTKTESMDDYMAKRNKRLYGK